jgi:hypothetical protein
VMPLLWLWPAGTWMQRLKAAALGCVLAAAGMFMAYAPWGWQLWQLTGNPVFPIFDAWFEPVRAYVGWRR